MTTQIELLRSAAARRSLTIGDLDDVGAGVTLWGAACAALRRAGATDTDVDAIAADVGIRRFGDWR